ncbi:Acetyltransferase, GNAT family protein [Pelagerythrobacter marensis]|uniref:Acetyltransferase, GNAT family protein n=2 Tax=Pelagerythrobacter marensis TaxID=543877 RepID=A0A0G3X795_9SPHN|nr:GNAT family N-acetyltransferase [Pelagerythrobacter marensis]AKM07435.1 Acetyltransferase, GNAT family protein [Pelagerythrobacter marensis]
MFHRSQRLLLRPPWPEDWCEILGGIADEGVVRNLARAPWPYRPHHAREFVASPAAPRFPRFVVARADNAAMVGCVGIDQVGNTAELGYWIARPYWGRGYATEAGRAALEIARMLGHSRIVASHFLDNPASGRVLQKLGFAATGAIRPRFSCGRGGEALAAEYALDLECECEPDMRAA